MFIGHFYFILWTVCFISPCVDWIVWSLVQFFNSLYILNSNSPVDAQLGKMASYSVGHLYTCLLPCALYPENSGPYAKALVCACIWKGFSFFSLCCKWGMSKWRRGRHKPFTLTSPEPPGLLFMTYVGTNFDFGRYCIKCCLPGPTI